jgi:hypothetical protein
MKWVLKTAVIGLAGFLAAMANSQAQVQQSISISLTLYNQNGTGIRTMHITTRDVIENLAGTTVPGAKLWLVMPNDPTPDGSGNIGAFLRITGSDGTVIDTTTDLFNVYQTFQSQTATRTVGFNQFSFAFGGLGAELYGTGTWTKSTRGPGGQGSFHCTVSGRVGLGGVTNGEVPCTGSISGGSPRPAQ